MRYFVRLGKIMDIFCVCCAFIIPLFSQEIYKNTSYEKDY